MKRLQQVQQVNRECDLIKRFNFGLKKLKKQGKSNEPLNETFTEVSDDRRLELDTSSFFRIMFYNWIQEFSL